MKCSLKCQIKMSSKLGGACGHSCALDLKPDGAPHEGKCKCRLMLQIDASVSRLTAADLKSLDVELKEKWREQSKRKRAPKTIVARTKKVSNG